MSERGNIGGNLGNSRYFWTVTGKQSSDVLIDVYKRQRLQIDEVNNKLRKKNDGGAKDFIDRGGQPDSLRYS